MNQLIDRIYTHSVHTVITETLNQLGQIKERRHFDNEFADEVIERAKYVLTYIQNKLNGIDPLLQSITTLDAMNQYIAPIQIEINNFFANGNIVHLHNIDGYVTNVLLQQGSLVVTQNFDDLAALKDIITGYKRSFGQHIANASKHVEAFEEEAEKSLQEVKNKVSEIESNIEEKVLELGNDIDELKENYNRDREQFLTDLNGSEQRLRAKLEGIDKETTEKIFAWDYNLRTIQDQIEELLESQKTIFESTLETSTTTMQTTFNDEFTEFQKNVRNIIENENRRLEELWGHLETKKKEVEELAGSVSITSMAGFYKTIADREKSSENIWKLISTGAFLMLISVTIFNAYYSSGNFSWGNFAPKIPVSIAFASFLAFCLRQLTVHRKHERYNRQTQLELSALEPYITTLGPEVSKEIKSKLADKLFGRADQMISVSSSDDKPEVISQEVLTLLDKLGTIIKGK